MVTSQGWLPMSARPASVMTTGSSGGPASGQALVLVLVLGLGLVLVLVFVDVDVDGDGDGDGSSGTREPPHPRANSTPSATAFIVMRVSTRERTLRV